YLNNDPALKDKFRFEMTKSGMMVYGTYKLLGQNVDFGMKMVPEVTKNGGILLHAKSVAVGQLPLPVKYVMGYLGNMVDLPKWLTIDTSEQTILIDLGKAPEVQGMRVKAVTIDPAKDKFLFRGGYSK
ncbi:MAG: YpmS family protein, partial [Weissella confusa]